MNENIQIKKLYYSPIKSFNFIESKSLKIIKNIGIEHDRVFAFVRNKTKEEAIKHDRIFINELAATLEDKELGYGASKLWDKVRADLDWFRKHNASAYMVLLD